MSTANKIKQCRGLRTICSNQIAELKGFADRSKHDEVSKNQFRIMYGQLESIQNEFRRNHQTIISLLVTQDDANIEAEEAIRKEFE